MLPLKSKRDYFHLILMITFFLALYFVYTYSAGNETSAERRSLLEDKDVDLFVGEEYDEDIGILYAVSKDEQYGYAHFKKAKFSGYELVDIYLTVKPILYKTVFCGSKKHDVFMTNIDEIESAKMTYCSRTTHDVISSYHKPVKKMITKESILVTKPVADCYFIGEITDSFGKIYKYNEKDLSAVTNTYHIAWYNKMAKNNLYILITIVTQFLLSTDNFYQLCNNGQLTKQEVFRYGMSLSFFIFYLVLLLIYDLI